MIKFLHAADLHLDSAFSGLPPQQAAQQRQEQRKLLELLCRLCKEHSCELLLLSGDLFDGQRVYRDTLDALRDALSDCGAQVFISPGNHDFLHPASPYLTQAWPENVHIFTAPKPEAIVLDSLGCVVYGAGFTATSMPPMLQGFRVADEYRDYVNFMVLHGDLTPAASTYNPICREEIASSGLTYLALGHIHQTCELQLAGGTYFSWPGCPMGRGFDETGEKGILLGQVDAGRLSCRFHPLGLRRYESLRVEAGESPLENILKALPEQTQEDIYRITLTGESDALSLGSLQAALVPRFYALQLRDQTVPPLDFWTRCGEDTLQGLALHTLQQTLERCETSAQRRCVELAARRICEVCEGREAPAL